METDIVKAFCRMPDFEGMLARPTFGYFAQVYQREQDEEKALRKSLASFGYGPLEEALAA